MQCHNSQQVQLSPRICLWYNISCLPGWKLFALSSALFKFIELYIIVKQSKQRVVEVATIIMDEFLDSDNVEQSSTRPAQTEDEIFDAFKVVDSIIKAKDPQVSISVSRQ